LFRRDNTFIEDTDSGHGRSGIGVIGHRLRQYESPCLFAEQRSYTKVTNPKDGQVKAEMVEESLEEKSLVNQQDQEDESMQSEEDDLDDQEDEDVPDEVQIKKKVATLRVNQEKVQYAEESKIREAQETLQSGSSGNTSEIKRNRSRCTNQI
jgi:hypothetical protein